MKLRTIITLILLAAAVSGCGTGVSTSPIKTDLKDIVWAIEPQYRLAGYFSSGLAVVELEREQNAFINKAGENVYNKYYSSVNSGHSSKNFIYQLPKVRAVGDDVFTEINITGKEILQQEYIFAEKTTYPAFDFGDETKNRMFSLVMQFGGRKGEYVRIAKTENGKYGLVNTIGQCIVEPEYDYLEFALDDLVTTDVGAQYGFISETLTYIPLERSGYFIPLMSSFTNGYALVEKYIRIGSSLNSRGVYNFIDLNGKLMLGEDIVGEYPQVPGETPRLSNGIITYYSNGLYGFMDIQGNVLIEPQYKKAGIFSEGLAFVVSDDNKCGYIDINNNLIVQLVGADDGAKFEDNMALATRHNRTTDEYSYGVINKSGEWIIQPEYDFCYYRPEHKVWELEYSRGDTELTDIYFVEKDLVLKGYEGVTVLSETAFTGQMGNKYYYVDVEDELKRYKFDYIGSGFDGFSEGLAVAELHGRKGYIDINGNLVHDFVFEEAYPFSEGLAAVKVDGKWGYIANPLVYDSWQLDETSRAIALGIVPADESNAEIPCAEFAHLLGQTLGLDESLLQSASEGAAESAALTREDAAVMLSRAAELRGKYHKYLLPDCEDRQAISENSKFHIGFAIQTGMIQLEDYRFNADSPVNREEAYKMILRCFEYTL